jgi:hypothetical protein
MATSGVPEESCYGFVLFLFEKGILSENFFGYILGGIYGNQNKYKNWNQYSKLHRSVAGCCQSLKHNLFSVLLGMSATKLLGTTVQPRHNQGGGRVLLKIYQRRWEGYFET